MDNKLIFENWRQFLTEASTEERVAATAKRAKAFDAKMRKKHYGAEDAEESQKPEDLKKSYAAKEQRAFKQSRGGEIGKLYFAHMAVIFAGHLSGKKPVGFERPKAADKLLKQFNQAFNSMQGLDNNGLIKFMKAAGLPTSLKFDPKEDKRQKEVAATQPEHDKEMRALLIGLYGEGSTRIEPYLKIYAGQRMRDPEKYVKTREQLLATKESKEGVAKVFALQQKWHELYMKQQGVIAQNLTGGKIFSADTEEIAAAMKSVDQEMQKIFAASNKAAGTNIK